MSIVKTRPGFLLTGIAVILFLLVALLRGLKPAAEEIADVPAELPAVVVQPVMPAIVTDRLMVSGEVVAWAAATLAAEKPGSVKTLIKEKGSDVTEGDLLVQIDPASWEQQVRLAEVEAENAARDFQRWERLLPSGAVSTNDYDAILSRHRLAQVRLADAKLQLKRCAVRAPFAGRVDERLVELGEYVNEGQAVCRVVDTRRLKVETRVSEHDIASVSLGDMVTFSVASLGAGSYSGRVSFVALEADPATHAYRVEIDVLKPFGKLRSGMITEVGFMRQSGQPEISVPLVAVVPHKGDHIAFVVVDDAAEQRVVRISRLAGEMAVLQSGLKAGDKLVVQGQRLLRDGSPVKVVDDAETPEQEPES
jgi:membrane fusion protein (multidrug efflux system)